MNTTLRQIDEQAEVLASLYANGRLSEARFLASIKKLTDRAEAILARMG
jgi:hypothetical protein